MAKSVEILLLPMTSVNCCCFLEIIMILNFLVDSFLPECQVQNYPGRVCTRVNLIYQSQTGLTES